MSNLKGKIPVLASSLIPTYDFVDVEEGIGVTTYYAYTSEDTGGTVYNLTRSQPFSYTISSDTGTLSGTESVFNFTTPAFNLPRVLKGTPLITLTWRVTNSSGSNDNHLIIRLIHVTSGGTETIISTATGLSYSSANGTMKTTALKLATITTPQLVKEGEFVRLEVAMVADTAGSTPVGHLAHDPQNRDDATFTTGNFDTTTLIFYVPFRIDR